MQPDLILIPVCGQPVSPLPSVFPDGLPPPTISRVRCPQPRPGSSMTFAQEKNSNLAWGAVGHGGEWGGAQTMPGL